MSDVFICISDFIQNSPSSTISKANKENSKGKKSKKVGNKDDNFILEVGRAPMRAIPFNVRT